VDHDARLEVPADELQKPLIHDTLCEPSHKDVVVDPVEEFLQVKIHHPRIAFRDVLLGVLDRPMSVLSRSKSITVRRELRRSLKLTQQAFGALVGVTKEYVNMLEKGVRTPSKTLKLFLDRTRNLRPIASESEILASLHHEEQTRATERKASKRQAIRDATQTETTRPRITATYPVTDAVTFAGIAISQLERIMDDDYMRTEAIREVFQWFDKELN
jgi:transcriptional regulator with XRE-family HTH domain